MEKLPAAHKRRQISSFIVSVIVFITSIALLGLFVWGAVQFLIFLLRTLRTLNPNIAAAIIAGSATIIAAVSVLVIGKYIEGKAQRREAHRDKKVNLYDSFLEKLFPLFTGGAEDKTPEDIVPVSFLRDIHRKLILWSGPEVIRAYAEWHKELTTQGNTPRAKAMIRMVDFFLALRKDLGHSNKSIKPEYIVRFMLKEPKLFMEMYRKNPDVTLGEIAAAEELLKVGKK